MKYNACLGIRLSSLLAIVVFISVCASFAATASPPATSDTPSIFVKACYKVSFEFWHLLAEKGYAKAQNKLGNQYSLGQGVAKDFAQALYWYQLAAAQGHIGAQSNIAAMYHDGEGVQKDFSKSVEWYRKAADRGDAWSEMKLGDAYYEGDGVPKDHSQAIVLFNKAADQEEPLAQSMLGVMYEIGDGAPKDFEKAFGWYLRASHAGNADAQVRIGMMYATGVGIPKSSSDATYWLRQAARTGNADAIKILRENNIPIKTSVLIALVKYGTPLLLLTGLLYWRSSRKTVEHRDIGLPIRIAQSTMMSHDNSVLNAKLTLRQRKIRLLLSLAAGFACLGAMWFCIVIYDGLASEARGLFAGAGATGAFDQLMQSPSWLSIVAGKNRAMAGIVTFGLVGFLLILGSPILYWLNRSEESRPSREKKCPFCAESIKYEAIVCKHCGKDLPAAASKQSS